MLDATPMLWVLIVISMLIAAVVLGKRIAYDPVFGVCMFVFLSSVTEMPSLPVVGDRFCVADFEMMITLCVTAFQGQLFRPAPPMVKRIDHAAFLFIMFATLSSLIALVFAGETLFIRCVLFMIMYIYGYLCFRIIIRLINTRERFVRVCLWWTGGAALVIIVGFLASTGVYKPEWTYDPVIMRINSTMKTSGQVSSYLGPALFILFYMAVNRNVSNLVRLGVIGLIGAGSVVLIGTGSRISMVILVFMLTYALLVINLITRVAIRRTPITLAAALGIFMFISFAAYVWSDKTERYGLVTTSPFERALRIFSENSDADADAAQWGGTRYEEISLASDILENHFFFGVGSGLFSETYQSNEIHNTYMNILTENGVFSFIAFAVWWWLMWRAIWQASRTAVGNDRLVLRLVMGACLSILIYQLTTNGMRQRPFWFVPAIAVSAVVISRQRQQLERLAPSSPGFVSSVRGGDARR